MLKGNGKSRFSSISKENGEAQVLLYFQGPWEKESNEKKRNFFGINIFFSQLSAFFFFRN